MCNQQIARKEKETLLLIWISLTGVQKKRMVDEEIHQTHEWFLKRHLVCLRIVQILPETTLQERGIQVLEIEKKIGSRLPI